MDPENYQPKQGYGYGKGNGYFNGYGYGDGFGDGSSSSNQLVIPLPHAILIRSLLAL
jgi:hypothetical protein